MQPAHEDYSRVEAVSGPPNRSFGLIFTAFFAIVGLWPLFSGQGTRVWPLIVSGVLLVISFVAPQALSVPNRVWTQFGAFLHRIVSPIMLGLLFFVVVTPFGVVMRLCGRDLLRLKLDVGAPSYWIRRDPPGPPPESMPNQF